MSTELIELYKIHINIMEKYQQRYLLTHKVYFFITTILLGLGIGWEFLVGQLVKVKHFAGLEIAIQRPTHQISVSVIMAIIGVAMSLIWIFHSNIAYNNYRIKLRILIKMEKELPFAFLTEEYKLMVKRMGSRLTYYIKTQLYVVLLIAHTLLAFISYYK